MFGCLGFWLMPGRMMLTTRLGDVEAFVAKKPSGTTRLSGFSGKALQAAGKWNGMALTLI
jgi:hypothetical protein